MSVNARRLANGRTVYDVRLRTPSGRQFKKTLPTKRQAEAFEAAQRVDQQRGSWVDPHAGAVTLADYAYRWLTLRPDLRPRTVELYEGVLRRHILSTLGDIELAQLSTARIRSWHADLVRDSRPGSSTVAKCYRLLRTILTTAVEDQLIVKNPCVLKRAGVERHAERPVATIQQLTALAKAVPPRYRMMVAMAGWTGLRFGELAGLSRRHVDLTVDLIRVGRQIQELLDGSILFTEPKTAAGRRTVALPPHLHNGLAKHLTDWAEPGSDGLVFPSPEGGPLRRHNFNNRVWRPATRTVGVSGLRFHDLRHTGNTLAAATGASTRELMVRMGHASPRAALIYQHSTPERDRAIAAALSRLAAGEAGPDSRNW